MTKRLSALLITALIAAGCALAQAPPHPSGEGPRYFRDVSQPIMSTHYALNCFSCPGAFADVVELDSTGSPVTGDTLTAWVQHYGAGGAVRADSVSKADMLISCNPEMLPAASESRRKHPFKDESGVLWVTWKGRTFMLSMDRADRIPQSVIDAQAK